MYMDKVEERFVDVGLDGGREGGTWRAPTRGEDGGGDECGEVEEMGAGVFAK